MDLLKILLKLVGVAKDYVDDSPKKERPVRQAQYTPRPVEPTVEREKTSEEWEAYFKEILQNEFPDCEFIPTPGEQPLYYYYLSAE